VVLMLIYFRYRKIISSLLSGDKWALEPHNVHQRTRPYFTKLRSQYSVYCFACTSLNALTIENGEGKCKVVPVLLTEPFKRKGIGGVEL